MRIKVYVNCLIIENVFSILKLIIFVYLFFCSLALIFVDEFLQAMFGQYLTMFFGDIVIQEAD